MGFSRAPIGVWNRHRSCEAELGLQAFKEPSIKAVSRAHRCYREPQSPEGRREIVMVPIVSSMGAAMGPLNRDPHAWFKSIKSVTMK